MEPYYYILDKLGNQFTFETMNFDPDNLILSLNTFGQEINIKYIEYAISNKDKMGREDRLDVYEIKEIIDYDKDRDFLKIKLEQLDTNKFDYKSWIRSGRIDFILGLIK
jgi:hypothetical protein